MSIIVLDVKGYRGYKSGYNYREKVISMTYPISFASENSAVWYRKFYLWDFPPGSIENLKNSNEISKPFKTVTSNDGYTVWVEEEAMYNLLSSSHYHRFQWEPNHQIFF